jgi:hypothetical protein
MQSRYIQLARLADALAAASLNYLFSGPLTVRLDAGELVLFDDDGKEVTRIQGDLRE